MFVIIVLLDRDTNMSSIVSCYVIHFVAVGKLLMHSWLLVRNDFQNRDEFKVLNIVKNSISICWDCFFFFTCWLFFHLLTIPIKDRVQVFSIVNNSNPYCWYPFSLFITKMNLLGFFRFFPVEFFLAIGSKVLNKFSPCRVFGPSRSPNSCLVLWELNVIGTIY